MTTYQHEPERYGNGKLKASQQDAARSYRQRQAQQRRWVSDLAALMGEDPKKMTQTPAAELVSRILRDPPGQ